MDIRVNLDIVHLVDTQDFQVIHHIVVSLVIVGLVDIQVILEFLDTVHSVVILVNQLILVTRHLVVILLSLVIHHTLVFRVIVHFLVIQVTVDSLVILDFLHIVDN